MRKHYRDYLVYVPLDGLGVRASDVSGYIGLETSSQKKFQAGEVFRNVWVGAERPKLAKRVKVNSDVFLMFRPCLPYEVLAKSHILLALRANRSTSGNAFPRNP